MPKTIPRTPVSLHKEKSPTYNSGYVAKVTVQHREFPTKLTSLETITFKCDHCNNYSIIKEANFCLACGAGVEFMFNNPDQIKLSPVSPKPVSK